MTGLLAGWLLLFFATPRPHLFTAAVSGFMLVALLLAAGLYEISRRRGEVLVHDRVPPRAAFARSRHPKRTLGLLRDPPAY